MSREEEELRQAPSRSRDIRIVHGHLVSRFLSAYACSGKARRIDYQHDFAHGRAGPTRQKVTHFRGAHNSGGMSDPRASPSAREGQRDSSPKTCTSRS